MKGASVRLVLFCIVLTLPAVQPRSALAQEEKEGGTYVQGGPIVVLENGETGQAAHLTYTAAPGGVTLGWTATAGGFVTPRLSIEGEFATTGVMQAIEPSRYDTTYVEEKIDRFLTANLRFHTAGTRRSDLESVVGAGLAFVDGASRADRQVWNGSGYVTQTGARHEYDALKVLTLLFGLDVRIQAARHVALIPSGRIRWYDTSDLERRYPNEQPASLVFTLGVTVRFGS